jgi:hypothetical protein
MFTAGYITEDTFSIEPESQGVHDFSLLDPGSIQVPFDADRATSWGPKG